MTEMQAFEADRIGEALDAVERGETVIIKRDGRTVARVVPEAGAPSESREEAFRALERLRSQMPRASTDEILAWRDEGRKR